MTAGSYPDDGLGEIFLKLGKQGSTLAGVMDAFSMSISVGLQYGIPLEFYVQKFQNLRFEPAGMTDDPDIRMAPVVLDYSSAGSRWTTCRMRSARNSASSPPTSARHRSRTITVRRRNPTSIWKPCAAASRRSSSGSRAAVPTPTTPRNGRRAKRVGKRTRPPSWWSCSSVRRLTRRCA